MRSSTVYEPGPTLARPPADLQLTNWPLRDDGPSAWAIVLLIIGVVIAAGVLSGSVGMALLALVALILSTWRMWLPVRYQFGPKGITQSILGRHRRISWSAVRRCEIRSRGLLLSPFDESSPLATMRGTFIRWGKNREELLAIVKYYLGNRAPQ